MDNKEFESNEKIEDLDKIITPFYISNTYFSIKIFLYITI